jgi:hypothetical protein
MKRLKQIADSLIALGVGGLLGALIFYGNWKTIDIPPTLELQERTSVSSYLSPVDERAVIASRQSAVRVFSVAGEAGELGSSTGTYVKAGKRFFVITVMHGILGGCEVTKVWTEEGGFVDCVQFMELNPHVDYAIIEVVEIPHLTPIRFPNSVPKGAAWSEVLAPQTPVYYTGYPNNTGPLTLDGRIIGYSDEGYIYMHSYAWGGSSGSGVFAADGKFIGYILAIDVGQTAFGISVLEDIVIVVPAFNINWSTIL